MNEDARDAMRDSDVRFRSAFEDAPIGMAHRRARRRRSSASTSCLCAATGRGEDELVGDGRSTTLTPEEDRDGAPWPPQAGVEIERRFMRADGSVGWGLWQHSLVRDADDAPAYWVSHVLDISARKGVERQLDYQAHHDPLTGLPNRTLFLQRLRELIADRATTRSRCCSSTSTTSRSSTTRSATAPATTCSRSSPSACGASCAPAT